MAEGGFGMDEGDLEMDDIGDILDDRADSEEGPDVDEETSLIDPVPIGAEQAEGRAGPTIESLRQEVLLVAVDNYYDALAEREGEPLSRDTTNFVLVGSELRLKSYPNVKIVNVRSRAPLALKTIYVRGGGAAIISGSGLGFVDWTYAPTARRKLPSPIQAQFEKVADDANAAATTDDPDSINEFVDRVISGVDDAAAAFPTGADTAAQTTETLPTDLLPLREILGLNENLKTIRGVKAVQESKKVSLQQLIEGYREDLERPRTTEQADQIEREIQKAEDHLRATQDSIDTSLVKTFLHFLVVLHARTAVYGATLPPIEGVFSNRQQSVWKNVL